MDLNPPVWCVTHRNPQRRDRMSARFDQLGIPATFVESPGGCMAGHIAALEAFTNTAHARAIVIEDDVMIRRDYALHIGMLTAAFVAADLDVLMMGYLWPHAARTHVEGDWVSSLFPRRITPFAFFGFPDDIWGAQMYMVSRSHARRMVDRYGPESGYEARAAEDPALRHYSPDFLITKAGNRALTVPMMGIEEGVPREGDDDEHQYRARTFAANHDPLVHI